MKFSFSFNGEKNWCLTITPSISRRSLVSVPLRAERNGAIRKIGQKQSGAPSPHRSISLPNPLSISLPNLSRTSWRLWPRNWRRPAKTCESWKNSWRRKITYFSAPTSRPYLSALTSQPLPLFRYLSAPIPLSLYTTQPLLFSPYLSLGPHFPSLQHSNNVIIQDLALFLVPLFSPAHTPLLQYQSSYESWKVKRLTSSSDIVQNARDWNERQNKDSRHTHKNRWYVILDIVLHFVS